MLPALPGWDGIHPLIVHFPIALLLVAPLLVAAALVARRSAQVLAVAALALMVIGTAGTFLAVATGQAAGERARGSEVASSAVEAHEKTGELTRTIFTGLTAIFLSLYLAGSVVLVNAAHQGGILVHQLGVRAALGTAPAEPALAAAGGEHQEEDENR